MKRRAAGERNIRPKRASNTTGAWVQARRRAPPELRITGDAFISARMRARRGAKVEKKR